MADLTVFITDYRPMSELSSLPSTPPGCYRHCKGGEYEVLGVARHSETHDAQVVYRPLCNSTGWWVRQNAMFFANVNIDGEQRRRFERVG